MIIQKYKLAKQLGVSPQAVYKWFTGKALPRADKLKKLSQVTGLSIEEVLALFKVKK